MSALRGHSELRRAAAGGAVEAGSRRSGHSGRRLAVHFRGRFGKSL